MEWSPLVVALIAGAFAVLPRVPALSVDGRARAKIQGDVVLWAAMPEGTARDTLRVHIDEATLRLVSERAKDRTVERGWLVGTMWFGAGLAVLVVAGAVPLTEQWLVNARFLLQSAGLGLAAGGVLIMAAVVALVTVRAVRWAVTRMAARVRWMRTVDDRPSESTSAV